MSRRSQPRLRQVAACSALIALASACVADRSETLSAECEASTDVTASLIASGGSPSGDPALASSLDELAVSSAAAAEVIDVLVPLVGRDEPMSAGERRVWNAGLDQLDVLVGDRCGFSMRVLVAAETAEVATGSGASFDESVVEEEALPHRSLDWSSLLQRVPDAEWLDRGLRGVVGLGPGVYVTVFGVESGEMAEAVCTDLVSALADEARTGEVVVEIQGLGDHVLAQSTAGDCFRLA